ncbi:MAG: hypothetical protein JWP82_3092 [Humibacillus sp.]|nr:hypothetical protein [Humibacillus sp.]
MPSVLAETQWVLRNARLHAADVAVRSAAGFAEGGGRAAPVHRAQVGRWETGRVGVSHALVRRYETVLELPEGQLLAAIDLFARSAEAVRPTATLSPAGEPDVEATLELLERALADERMSALDWDRLSDNLGRMPHAMVRAGDWERLLRRGIEEVSLHLTLDYVQRAEAVARLAGHRRSGAIVAAMAEEVVAQPDATFYNDTLSLLQFTAHPQALSMMFRQLREPTNSSSLRACLIVLTTLVKSGRLERDVRLEAARLAVVHLRADDQPYRVHRGAANLIRALGPVGTNRLATVLTAQDRRVAAAIIRDGRTVASQAIRESQKRIRAALDAGEETSPRREPVLAQLVTTALGETNEEDRSNALAVLMISPQSQVLSRVHVAALVEALRRSDMVAAHESLAVLTWMGPAADLDLLERLALAPKTPADIAQEAAYVIGNTIEPPSRRRDERERVIADRIVALGRGPAPSSADADGEQDRLRGLVYVLGMRDRRDLLRGVRDALPPTPTAGPAEDLASGIVDWWLDLPGHLRPMR